MRTKQKTKDHNSCTYSGHDVLHRHYDLGCVFRKSETKSLVPDYAPQQTEQNAEPLENNSRSLDVPEGGGGISLEYENTVNIKLSDKTAYFSYKHPSSSTQDIVLCIEIMVRSSHAQVL